MGHTVHLQGACIKYLIHWFHEPHRFNSLKKSLHLEPQNLIIVKFISTISQEDKISVLAYTEDITLRCEDMNENKNFTNERNESVKH